MVRGGAGIEVTDMDIAEVGVGVVRDEAKTGGPVVGGAGVEGGIAGIGRAIEVGGVIGTAMDGAAAVVVVEGARVALPVESRVDDPSVTECPSY